VAKLHALKAELRLRMNEPVAAVGAWLRKVVNGYYRYHAVPGNIDRLSLFGQRLRRLWRLIGIRERVAGADLLGPIACYFLGVTLETGSETISLYSAFSDGEQNSSLRSKSSGKR